MSKFAQLQSSAILQMAGEEPLAQKMSVQARQFVAVSALIVMAAIADPALAQNNYTPLNPSNCSNLGAGVGAIVGGMAAGKGANWEARALGAALGTFGGKVAGHMLCSQNTEQAKQQVQQQPQTKVVYVQAPQQPQPQVIYVQHPSAASTGTAHQAVGLPPQSGSISSAALYAPSTAAQANEALSKISYGSQPQALSSAEMQRMEAYTRDVLDKKAAWKEALQRANGAGTDSGAAAQAQADFEAARKEYATVVYRLAQGSQSEGKPAVAPRDVSRYLEVSASLLELPTQRGVTWKQVAQADMNLEVKRPLYSDEVSKAYDARVKSLR